MQRALWLVVGLGATVVACASSVGPGDGGDVISLGGDVRAGDVAASDASDSGSVTDAGAETCGDASCAAGQYCMIASGGAVMAPSCQDLPAACNGTLSCACTCPMDTSHTCTQTGRTIACSCNVCP